MPSEANRTQHDWWQLAVVGDIHVWYQLFALNTSVRESWNLVLFTNLVQLKNRFIEMKWAQPFGIWQHHRPKKIVFRRPILESTQNRGSNARWGPTLTVN